VAGQRRMQAASDIFLDWFRTAHGHDYYVRQFRDMKVSAEVETFRPGTLLPVLAQTTGNFPAVILTALLFALFHHSRRARQTSATRDARTRRRGSQCIKMSKLRHHLEGKSRNNDGFSDLLDECR
jgi:uncharacterized protein DUF2252